MTQQQLNFQFGTYKGFIERTNLSSNEKAFLVSIAWLSYQDGQSSDGQTFTGSLKFVGQCQYLRRSLNTTRDIKKQLTASGLLAVTTETGRADCYCINWDQVLNLPTIEETADEPPPSKVGPLQFYPSTPPKTGGPPSRIGGVPLPKLEAPPPKTGGVTPTKIGGVPPETQAKNEGTPPVSTSHMSMSVLKTKRQRHVQQAWWPKDIVPQNLRHPPFVQELWLLAVKNGWYSPTDANREHFFSHASRCCSAKSPGAAFTANVRNRRLFSRPEDREWAVKAIEGLERPTLDAAVVVEGRSNVESAQAALQAWISSRTESGVN